MLVVGDTLRMSLNARSQTKLPPVLGVQRMLVVGGGLLQLPELAMLPFTFQVTTADLML
jgi:hypothetical protein